MKKYLLMLLCALIMVHTACIGEANQEEEITFDHKPGISGSNAYDLTIGAKDSGLEVGQCVRTFDGYSWTITGFSSYGVYSIVIESNDSYELHRVTFTHTGTDKTFFPWAVTLPFDAADIEGATAWIKECQKNGVEGTFATGDAVWTYKPHDNGRGGILWLTVDTFDAYSDYLLNLI